MTTANSILFVWSARGLATRRLVTKARPKTLAKRRLRRRDDRRGATAVEYAVILGLILLAMIGALVTFGTAVQESYNGSSGSINSYVGQANSQL